MSVAVRQHSTALCGGAWEEGEAEEEEESEHVCFAINTIKGGVYVGSQMAGLITLKLDSARELMSTR